MDQQTQVTMQEENVTAGIVGAFLFSLAGGILWYVLYLFGFIAAVSGLVGAVCAVKGYAIFAKKESIKGIVISVIIAFLVIVVAWFFCLVTDIYNAHLAWYEAGEIDFKLSFVESVWAAPYYLTDMTVLPAYLKDLGIGLLFCIVGAGSFVRNKIRTLKKSDAEEKGSDTL